MLLLVATDLLHGNACGNFWALIAAFSVDQFVGGTRLPTGRDVFGAAPIGFHGGGVAASFFMRDRLRVQSARLGHHSASGARRERAGL